MIRSNLIGRITATGVLLLAFLPLTLFTCGTSQKIAFVQAPNIVLNPNDAAPLTCYVDFGTTVDYEKATFRISGNGRDLEWTYTPAEKKESGYLLTLMRPKEEYAISIGVTDKNGKETTFPTKLIFKTPTLPESDAEFPKIEVTVPSTVTDQEQLTLINPRRRVVRNAPGENEFNKSFGMLAITNQRGEVLWYYQTNSRISDFDLLPNGNISYMTQDSRLVEIDLAGNVQNHWYAAHRPEGPMEGAIPVDALTFHHDAALLPNGNRLILSSEVRQIPNYYTSEKDSDAIRQKQSVMGDVILEFTPGGKVVHRWHVFDHLPVERIGYETFSRYWERRGFPGVIDWSHANAVVPIAGEDAYLVNFRYQSAMVKVNKKQEAIEWIFAEPSGWGEALQDKLLQIPEDGWNWHQHSPRYTASGNLLFFNNNNYQARPFEEPAALTESPSYVVEYQIDEANRKAERVWSSLLPDEDPIISIAMGRVAELAGSGHVLACFGAILSTEHLDEMNWSNRARFPQWTMVREYKQTTPTEIVWEMKLLPRTEVSSVGWTLFGAERVKFKNLY